MLTATSISKDRKHKSVSEQYVRERKSNAQKQFAYNKLKNEKQITLKHEQTKSNTAPKRPPQPKHTNFDKKEKEGMLIDLSSPQQQTAQDTASALIGGGDDCGGGFIPKVMNGMSILDTPIDVPTEGYPDDESQTVDYFTNESNKLEPPPYQSPPTYMNTYTINNSVPKYVSTAAVATAAAVTTTSNQYGNLDPFDTSHISTASSSQSNNAMLTYAYTSQLNATSRLDSSFIQNPIQKTNYMDLASVFPSNRSVPSATAELDEIVQNKIASLSPKRSLTPIHTERHSNSMASSMITNDYYHRQTKSLNLNPSNDDLSFKTGGNSTLSDSLKVNLSSLTLNDTDDFEGTLSSASASATTAEQTQYQNPKLDRAFLAELEKKMYTCDQTNVNMNNINAKDDNADAAAAVAAAAAPNDKDTSKVNTTFNWYKNDFTNINKSGGSNDTTNNAQTNHHPSRNAAMTQSPAKIYNNGPTMMKRTNYETSAANMTLSKKLYNTDVNNIESSGYQVQSLSSMTATTMVATATATTTMTTTSMQNDFEPVIKSNNMHKTLNSVANNANRSTNTNSTYAIASDIYGGGSDLAGGNIYDIVASSGNSDYYQMIQPNDSQTVIYDEVAADDDLMRPHRPAPGPPTCHPSILSAQQIQRRIERAQKEQSQQQQQQIYDNLASTYANGFNGVGSGGGSSGATKQNHYIYEEIMQKNSNVNCANDGINRESKETINAASSETMKNMKIEHLLR